MACQKVTAITGTTILVPYHGLSKSHGIEPSHKSHNASDEYPKMHHFLAEMCTHMHISVTKWCIVGYGTGALWDLRNWSIVSGLMMGCVTLAGIAVITFLVTYKSSHCSLFQDRAPVDSIYGWWVPLRWRHYGHDSVSNHQPHHCLLNRLFGCRSNKTSKLRVTGHVCREFTGDRWIPSTNGQ